jgi:hypothetical protein
MTSMHWRWPNAGERRLIEFLLRQPFSGKAAIVDQLTESLVRTLDEDGSLEFQLKSGKPPTHPNSVIAEAVAFSQAGIRVHALLHTNSAGYVSELELFTEDGSQVGQLDEIVSWKLPWPTPSNEA